MIKTANPIPYKEFTLLHQKLTQAELIRGFTYLDCYNSGRIDAESLKTICVRQGIWRDEAVKALLEKAKA